MAVVFRVDDKTKKKLIDYYKLMFREKTPPYAVFQAEEAGTIVTLYDSGKVMFQGENAEIDAQMWQNDDVDIPKVNTDDVYNINAIGSDEVGTGDYFGPIVVTAAYVSTEDIPFLEELGIKDSKKLTDPKIESIVPQIVKKLYHKSITMSPKEYNKYQANGYNMNKIKAIMHNKALYNLVVNNDFEYDKIIVDEFASPKNYFKYIEDVEKSIKNITFMTKAEDKNLAVAVASLISRYIFINEMDKLSDKYKMPLKKGAGEQVDKCGKELVTKYGEDVLKDIAKINFKNTKKIKDTF